MKTDRPDPAYETWLARRREDFGTVDLSYLVMKSIRAEAPPARADHARLVSLLSVPSGFVTAARLVFFAVLVLTPA